MARNIIDRSFTKQSIRAMIVGILLYGLTSYLTAMVPVDGSSLRPAVVILTVFGALYGPYVGFFAGTLGALINDLLARDVWYHWILGNGLIGLFSGLPYFLKGFHPLQGMARKIHYVLVAACGIAGNYLGLLTAVSIDLVIGTPGTDVISWALVPATVNALWVITLGILLLWAIVERSANQKNDEDA